MPRFYGKPDAAQPDVVKALRKAGAHVVILSGTGAGVADLACFYRSATHWIEVKSDERATKRQGVTATRQAEFRSRASEHGVTVHVVTTPDEALRAVGAMDRRGSQPDGTMGAA